MISNVGVVGFKRFKKHSFDLRPLSVFTGMNGAGKTSVIHSLLLVQNAWDRNDGVIKLNGPFGLELGGFGDVLNHETASSFSISLKDDAGVSEQWVFTEGDTELYASVTSPASQTYFVKESRSFQYLHAERLGPRITQRSAALPSHMLEVGHGGEFCAQVLEILGKMLVDEKRLYSGMPEVPPLLKAQAEIWLSSVTRPLQIDTESFPGTGVNAMRFRTGDSWVKPTNMGFGVTYALPVILAGLTAAKGGLLIVENPEAHLHPAGQSQMGVFLATIAAAGVQVVIESHSDHVLNGIRLAIGRDKTLKSSDAIVHYFDGDDSSPCKLEFTELGGISDWPKGFFDQYQIDVAALTRVRRPRD